MSVAFLEIDHVTKHFPSHDGPGEVCVFREVAFSIAQGEFVTMVGHSGCGKSTLLNIIAGLERASGGGVVLEGREITQPGIDRMVVFQNFSLMPWMTVFENVRLAVRAAYPSWDRRRIAAHVQRYVEMVGLARAFSTAPKVLLLDEPFAQIDALTRGLIQDELIRMWTAGRNTVFMVTHDVDEAILLSDRIALMTRGPEARLAEIVDVDIPRPRLRAALIEDPDYLRLRAHILRFLVEGTRAAAGDGHGAPATAPLAATLR